MADTRHIVALSGGKDSTAMALRLRELHPDVDYDYICTPTGNELPDMVDHWKRIGDMLGKPLRPVTTGKSIQGEIRRQKCLPNHRMRWCTRILKIDPFWNYIKQHTPCVCYVGLRYDEAEDREGVDHSRFDGVENRYPLIEWHWGIEDVLEYLAQRGVTVPPRTDCAMCFFQRLGEWWRLWRDHPGLYQEAVGLEDLVGHTLRSDQRDTWPAALRDLRGEFEAGRIPKGAAQQELELGTYSRKAMCSWCAR